MGKWKTKIRFPTFPRGACDDDRGLSVFRTKNQERRSARFAASSITFFRIHARLETELCFRIILRLENAFPASRCGENLYYVTPIYLRCNSLRVFNAGGDFLMNDTTETKKSTARSGAMARTWAARREWAANPVCCCGCGTKLAVGKDPERQHLFAQGHDGRLHKLLRQVLRGEASRQDIPVAARANLARIKFIQNDREIQKAFANPGQKTNRQRQLEA
jgi:hypothetical protein